MIYRITRQVLKHKHDSAPIGSVIATMDCEQKEMINSLYLLKRLAMIENKGYITIGSSTRVRYIVSEVTADTIDNVVTKLKGLIHHHVVDYNLSIKRTNLTLKRANAKNKGADTIKPLIPELNVKEYLSPFVEDAKYKYIDKFIIVEDDE